MTGESSTAPFRTQSQSINTGARLSFIFYCCHCWQSRTDRHRTRAGLRS